MKTALFEINGKYAVYANTALCSLALMTTVIVALCAHSKKIIDSAEWLPPASKLLVFYPERSWAQILMAISSGPRFVLVLIWILITRGRQPIGDAVAISGAARILFGGGIIYITEKDDFESHNLFVILYVLATLAWMISVVECSVIPAQRQRRKRIFLAVFFTFIPIMHYYTQHKVYQVVGAESKSTFFVLILTALDIAFDNASAVEFESIKLSVDNILKWSEKSDAFV